MSAIHRTHGLAALGLAVVMAGFSGQPSFAESPAEAVPNAPSSTTPTSLGVLASPEDVDTQAEDANCPQLELADNWYGDNAELIQNAIDEYGRCSWPDGTPPEEPRFAIFDWDNTVIKNDISDQTIFWMLNNDKILQPPERNWHYTSRYMTVEGAEALRQACGALAEPGEPLPTSTNVECADEILSVRKTEETTDGDRVFYGANHRYMNAMYAWVGQIMQGYTPAEVQAIAAEAREAALNAPIGATQQVGSSTQTAWIRYYPEMKDLIQTLKRAGIEPWIVTASPKEFADAWGPGVGIDSDHTIGIFQLVEDSKLTGHLRGCGGLPDGSDAIMTYIDGKRCFMNQTILGIEGAEALRPAPESQRPVLGAGDSSTDLSMVKDAVGVHIAINRNSAELMCHAYDNADNRWVINPMFIEPLPKRDGTYSCSTDAYTDGFGNPGPVRRADGSIIPDQEDTVFGGSEPTVTATPTQPPSPPATTPPSTGNLYTTPGYHRVNGRDWFTTCEPYSVTRRCTTRIWATQVTYVNGEYMRSDGWAFNNLTYLPSPRSAWRDNPLGYTGSWTSTDGRNWRTECDTPRTGRNGCRSWIEATVVEQSVNSAGQRQYTMVTAWVLNNIVLFT